MIKRLRVKNYKSLKNLDLQLKPLTVLVGPNNAGKSNILDAFQFLRDFVQQGQGAVNFRGGFQSIVWDGRLENSISLDIDGEITTQSQRGRRFSYHIDLTGNQTDVRITEERFLLDGQDHDKRLLLEFPWGTQQLGVAFDESGQETGKVSVGAHRSYLANFSNQESYPFLGHFSNQVQQWVFYNFVPSRMRDVGSTLPELVLRGDGGNLASVLHTIQSQYREDFFEIEDVLKTAVPGISQLFSPLSPSGQAYISIKEEGLKSAINSWAMSDGALCLLGYLCVLYGPSPPPMVVFEEPENYIHPRMLELLADILRNGSDRSQIIITTHSPYLLDFLDLDGLVIVEKKRGETEVKEASEEVGIKEALKTLGLGELWYSGSLGGVP